MQVFQEITEALTCWNAETARPMEQTLANREFLLGEGLKLACLIEATSRKAGNVHPFASFDDLTYADFCRSGESLAKFSSDTVREPTAADQATLTLGKWIEQAVEASQRATTSNVNLGIVLLVAPLAVTWSTGISQTAWQQDVGHLIAQSTTVDAAAMYRAIISAKPGGLGNSATQDVRETPTVTLKEAMHLARERDQIAACYDDGFASLFQHWVPRLKWWIDELARVNSESYSRDSGWALPPAWWEVATIGLQLEMIARHGDSLIARKLGLEFHREVQFQARKVLESGWPFAPAGWQFYHTFDHWLRADGHKRNPGTTADFIAATWFVYLRTVLSP